MWRSDASRREILHIIWKGLAIFLVGLLILTVGRRYLEAHTLMLVASRMPVIAGWVNRAVTDLASGIATGLLAGIMLGRKGALVSVVVPLLVQCTGWFGLGHIVRSTSISPAPGQSLEDAIAMSPFYSDYRYLVMGLIVSSLVSLIVWRIFSIREID